MHIFTTDSLEVIRRVGVQKHHFRCQSCHPSDVLCQAGRISSLKLRSASRHALGSRWSDHSELAGACCTSILFLSSFPRSKGIER